MSDTSAGSMTTLDRLAPTRRPSRRAVMRQTWSHLLFLHWEVPAESLRPLLPPGLELDLFEGRAYVGLVPFTMSGVRPAGLPPLPGLSQFHETNVRTYVHKNGRDPGVWFFSLDAANPVAVVSARTWFHLPYHYARMELILDQPGPKTIAYASERRWPGPLPAASSIQCAPQGPITTARPGTLEHFLIERYLLYASWHDRLYRGQVHHTPYPIQLASILELDESLLTAAGIRRPSTPPLAHFSEGVRVEVFSLQRV